MDRSRALEIIAAYGGDAARWPVEARAAAEALIASDPELAAARAAAATLDDALEAWAAAPMIVDDIAALRAADAALAQLRPVRRWWRFAAGSALAAGLAAIALQSPPGSESRSAPPVAAAPADTRTLISRDAAVMALVFTATPEEESLI